MRIAMISPYGYWGRFNPKDLYERTATGIQIGGGETAMLQIARSLAKLGHEVTVFYDTAEPSQYSGVDFLPTSMAVAFLTCRNVDVLVSWDESWTFRYRDTAKIHVLAFQLNSPVVGVFDWLIDLYFHPSQWHADMTRDLCPEVPADKQRVRFTNGVDYSRYANTDVPKNLRRVIYSSSPDRGLHHLLRIWPEVVSQIPDATLHIFYDMSKWLAAEREVKAAGGETVTSDRARTLEKQLANLHPSVHMHGAVDQWRLAEEQLRSGIMAYPCDPIRPTEGFSMSILEGITAGCRVVTTDADALGELWSGAPNVTTLPLPIDDAKWIDTLVTMLRNPPEISSVQYNHHFAWDTIAGGWETEFYQCLKAKQPSQ